MYRVYRIMIHCPDGGLPVDTGIQVTSPEEFETGFWYRKLDCPRCGRVHPWKQEDAFLLINDARTADRSLWRPNQ